MPSENSIDAVAELRKMIHIYQTTLPRSMSKLLVRSAKDRLSKTLRLNRLMKGTQ